jgi:hypothetical protein
LALTLLKILQISLLLKIPNKIKFQIIEREPTFAKNKSDLLKMNVSLDPDEQLRWVWPLEGVGGDLKGALRTFPTSSLWYKIVFATFGSSLNSRGHRVQERRSFSINHFFCTDVFTIHYLQFKLTL